MSDPDDEQLRRAMKVLREEDASRAPDFRAMVDRPAPPRSIASRFRAAGPVLGSLAVAAAVLAVWVGQRPSSAPVPMAAAPAAAPPADLSGGSGAVTRTARTRPSRDDVAPLDFLLGDTAGAAAFVAASPSTLDFLVRKDPAR